MNLKEKTMFGFLNKTRASERLYSSGDLAKELNKSPNLVIYHIKRLCVAPVPKFAGKNVYGESALTDLSSFFEAKRKHDTFNLKQQTSA